MHWVVGQHKCWAAHMSPSMHTTNVPLLFCPLVQAAEGGGTAAQRDLSSARLHLRGLIKQAADRYDEETAYKQLQEMLAEVEERQRQAQPS